LDRKGLRERLRPSGRRGLAGLAKFGLAVCFAAVVLALAGLTFSPVMSFSSLNSTFNITENFTFFNWTGPANITLVSYVNYTYFTVDNSSTWIYGIYWQNDTFYSQGSYSNFNADTINRCRKDGSATGSMGFAVENNVTNNQSSWNFTGPGVNSTLFNLSYYAICPPGKYYGNFSVRDAGNSTEHANVTATIIIPLSGQNTINTSGWNYTGFIHGKMPPKATYYHSYYFNLTELANATGLTINMSGFNQTLGMFLFYGNNTPMAQCENSTNCEIPFIQIANATDFSIETRNMLELRVYGNFSSGGLQQYDINFYYSTVNITNDTSDSISVLDFGTLNPSNMSSNMNFMLKNVGGKNYSNINQSVDFWWTKTWSSIADQAQNGTQSNFSIIVPNFTTQIEVSLQWRNVTGFTNLTEWDLYLADPRGRIVANSTGAFFNSNLTNATVTEGIVYSGAFNASNTGIWNITVNGTGLAFRNLTTYTVSVKMRFNVTNLTSWVRTNFTETYPFNHLSNYTLDNNTRYVTANISVPATQLLNGTYEGFIQYSNAGASGAGWKVRLPIKFQVNVPALVINNSIYNTTIRTVENTGFHRIRQINISLSNVGGASFIYGVTNSSNLTRGSSNYINFTVDTSWLNASGGIMQARENRSINLTLYINTSDTGNTQGLYTGWITFNITQNNTNNISIHNTFNINIEVNLTNNLVVNISQYMIGSSTPASDVGVPSKYNPFINVSGTTHNITIVVNASLQNGTVLSDWDLYKMNESNFTSASMVESNVTTYSVALTNIRDGSNGGTVCNSAGFCLINVTIPANVPGGRYNLSTTVQFNTTENTNATSVVLTGSGQTYPLTIWAPGIKLSTSNSTSFSMGEYVDNYFNVTVTNYGPQEATGGIIYMNNSCTYVVVNSTGSYGNINGTCTIGSNTASNYFTVSSMPGNGTSCWVLFKIHSVNVSAARSCDASTGINVSTSLPSFNNITGIDVSIGDTDGGPGGTGTTTGSTTLPTYTYNRSVRIMSYTSAFSARLGDNTSTDVSVKNTGNTTSIVWLTATTNNSEIITAVGPSFISLAAAATGTYTVYMNVSNSSRLGLFAGTLKAYVEGYTDTWYDTKPFDFTVLSTPERAAQLNVSFANYTAQFENLTAIFNTIKSSGLADIGNVTRVGQMINDTADLIQMINAAINSSNYAAAESLITELGSRLGRIQTELATLQASKSVGEQKFFGDLTVWIVVGLVIAGAAGVVIYMLLPPKPGSGFRRIKGLSPEKGKPPKEKKEGGKAEGSGVTGKLKGIFRRKGKSGMDSDADAIKKHVEK